MKKISLLANPNQVRPKRFWGVYTKLKIFNMTNYKKGKLNRRNFETSSCVDVDEEGIIVSD